MLRYLLLSTLFYSLALKAQMADTTEIKKHLNGIVNTLSPRDYLHLASLNQVADYIHDNFSNYTDSVRFQPYLVLGKTFKNVIASFNTTAQKRIVIGAHYDVCGAQDGADDNASGVVGLLELARLLSEQNLNYRIDLVAYSLEEPPFFRSENMGSYIHAKSLYDNDVDVLGMICLEMIGFFSDEPGSQRYPLKFLRLFYGDRGDFITTVKKIGPGRFARKFAKAMKDAPLLPSKSFQGPKRLAGLDFSDHQNYWKFHYSAVMVTNTSFYRNSNYHKKSDTIETLDILAMSNVIDTVFKAIMSINN